MLLILESQVDFLFLEWFNDIKKKTYGLRNSAASKTKIKKIKYETTKI